jgi:hypothetical protein
MLDVLGNLLLDQLLRPRTCIVFDGLQEDGLMSSPLDRQVYLLTSRTSLMSSPEKTLANPPLPLSPNFLAKEGMSGRGEYIVSS